MRRAGDDALVDAFEAAGQQQRAGAGGEFGGERLRQRLAARRQVDQRRLGFLDARMVDGGGEHVGAHHHAGAAARRRVIDGAMAAKAELANGHRAQRPQSRFAALCRRARCRAARETSPGTASAPLPARADAHLCWENAACHSPGQRSSQRSAPPPSAARAFRRPRRRPCAACRRPGATSWPRRTPASWRSRAPSRSCRTRCTTLRGSPSPSTIFAWPPPHNAPPAELLERDLRLRHVLGPLLRVGHLGADDHVSFRHGLYTPPVVSISSALARRRLRFADVVDKGFRDHLGIVGLRDRAADDDVVGAGCDGVAGRRDALLVVGGAAGETDARRDDEEAGADRLADARRPPGPRR